MKHPRERPRLEHAGAIRVLLPRAQGSKGMAFDATNNHDNDPTTTATTTTNNNNNNRSNTTNTTTNNINDNNNNDNLNNTYDNNSLHARPSARRASAGSPSLYIPVYIYIYV